MAKQTINIGASPNDGTGTPLRTSFDYCNLNFTELYTATGPSGNNIVVPGTATITGDLTVDTSTLKVDSTNNRVGIGTATPSNQLHVKSTSSTPALIETSGGALTYLQFTSTTGSAYIGNNANGLGFYTTGSADLRMSLAAAGDLSITSGNVVMGTANKGIDFSINSEATGMTSELLNDYEEGTFTPSIGGTATYTTQSGRYTKIGNRVYASIRLTVLLVGTGSSFLISGLPFALGASANPASVSVGYFTGLAISVNYISAFATGSAITMTATTSANTSITSSAAVIGNTTDLALSFFYEV
jgi:hypothetical protein